MINSNSLATILRFRNPCEQWQLLLTGIRESEAPGRLAYVDRPTAETPSSYVVKVANPKPGLPDLFCYLPQIPPEVLSGIRTEAGVLVLDHSNEGRDMNKNNDFEILHARLKELALPPHRVVMLTQNRLTTSHYEQWRENTGLTAKDGIRLDYYHAYLRFLINYVRTVMRPSGEYSRRREHFLNSSSPAGKHYLCLNFTPRVHRVATILYLLKHDLLDRGLVSFSGLLNHKLDVRDKIEQKLPLWFPDIENLKSELPRLIDLGPMLLDVDPAVQQVPAIDVGKAWFYEKSCFSLVTENNAGSTNSCRRFTEKIFKPILGLHPFLVLGSAHALEDIRALGFKTFHPMIDESYDEIEDGSLRVQFVLDEFSRLCAMPIKQLRELCHELQPIVLHNYDHFALNLSDQFVSQIENPVLQTLNDLAASSAC